MTGDPQTQAQLAAENELLRARVAELEAELTAQAARTNAIVAEAQERTYWLDRWHLDLNSAMARPGAAQARGVVRLLRWPLRQLHRLRGRLRG
ncbi:unannotated protein [freshwater metagenome]|uniref:Unannotated protein n=1 Tax=freshwater metagenome TaxID=449393 RepID=A0A6J7DZP3_9ZZZZ|nr:hypothetical protein [Actinomycetota bacterium]